jgi:hypothetical protein
MSMFVLHYSIYQHDDFPNYSHDPWKKLFYSLVQGKNFINFCPVLEKKIKLNIV